MNVQRLITMVLAAALYAQCGNAANDPAREARARVTDAVWQYHLAVIKAVVAARNRPDVTMDLAQFGRSVDIVESLTKIASNTGTRVGRVPTPELPRTIQLWEQWYADNKDRVDVDVNACSLQISSN